MLDLQSMSLQGTSGSGQALTEVALTRKNIEARSRGLAFRPLERRELSRGFFRFCSIEKQVLDVIGRYTFAFKNLRLAFTECAWNMLNLRPLRLLLVAGDSS